MLCSWLMPAVHEDWGAVGAAVLVPWVWACRHSMLVPLSHVQASRAAVQVCRAAVLSHAAADLGTASACRRASKTAVWWMDWDPRARLGRGVLGANSGPPAACSCTRGCSVRSAARHCQHVPVPQVSCDEHAPQGLVEGLLCPAPAWNLTVARGIVRERGWLLVPVAHPRKGPAKAEHPSCTIAVQPGMRQPRSIACAGAAKHGVRLPCCLQGQPAGCNRRQGPRAAG